MANKKIKIHCVEEKARRLGKYKSNELNSLVGWIEPPDDLNPNWMVTLSNGDMFGCSTQEIAQILSSTEEVKALLLNKEKK